MQSKAKSEMQSVNLEDIMQKHKVHPEYNIALPKFYVKKNSLAKLTKGDVLLVGLSEIELFLMQNSIYYAKVVLESVADVVKLCIVTLEDIEKQTISNKKQEVVICSFCKIQCRKLEVNHKIEISSFHTDNMELLIDNKKLAQATLVNVDNEIAIEIKEVYSE